MEGCVAIEAYRLGKTLFEKPTSVTEGRGVYPGQVSNWFTGVECGPTQTSMFSYMDIRLLWDRQLIRVDLKESQM